MKHSLNHGGFTLLELLVVTAVMGILATSVLARPSQRQAQQQVEIALRRLRVGLDRGRLAAERSGAACGLSLFPESWGAGHDQALPPCRAAVTTLTGRGADRVQLRSNLPQTIRFTANGLVLDGGLVLLSHPDLVQQRCLVIGLPLGITRVGTYQSTSPDDALSSAHCRPKDES
ncbi:MAG: type II secretion system protein [Synechococcus sp.]|nr:type II secretion system protein [Synechococcus sp.]